MALTPNLGLAGPLISGVNGWIARLKADLTLIDQAAGGMAGPLNLLVNPRMTVWQRTDRLGQTGWSGNGQYTADRWRISIIGASGLSVARLTPGWDAGSPYALRATYTHVSGGAADTEQPLEGWAALKGMTVSLRARVRTSTPNAVCVLLNDGTANTRSGFHPGDGTVRTLTCTLAISPAAITLLACPLYFSGNVSATADVENVSLVLGSTPLPCVPLDPHDELGRCLRYLEVLGGASGYPYIAGSASGAGIQAVANLPYSTPKGGSPTVTLAGTWTKSPGSIADPVVFGSSPRGVALGITSDAAGQFAATPNTATIASEWNP